MSKLQATTPALGAENLASLVAEIHRYLAAVDLFRREGREPRWLPEGEKEALS